MLIFVDNLILSKVCYFLFCYLQAKPWPRVAFMSKCSIVCTSHFYKSNTFRFIMCECDRTMPWNWNLSNLNTSISSLSHILSFMRILDINLCYYMLQRNKNILILFLFNYVFIHKTLIAVFICVHVSYPLFRIIYLYGLYLIKLQSAIAYVK